MALHCATLEITYRVVLRLNHEWWMEIMGRNCFLIAYFASYRIQRDVYQAGIVRITETNDRQITTLVNVCHGIWHSKLILHQAFWKCHLHKWVMLSLYLFVHGLIGIEITSCRYSVMTRYAYYVAICWSLCDQYGQYNAITKIDISLNRTHNLHMIVISFWLKFHWNVFVMDHLRQAVDQPAIV